MTPAAGDPALGVHPRAGGVDVALLAAHAEAVELCLLQEPDGAGGWVERRIELPAARYGVWSGFVPDVPVGTRYGFRVHGPWQPRRGHRHNPAKLLLDPYARGVVPADRIRPELFGHTMGRDLQGDPAVRDRRDSAPYAPHAVVLPAAPPAPPGPAVPWPETVLYEAHVRGLTKTLPAVPPEQRGTYAGLAHDAVLEHLTGLGVTSVELLPVHAFVSEPGLVRRGLGNYWGYNTLGFFAPHAAYAASRADGPAAVRAEFRAMVARLHAAGLEVLLDVVYNHTCEGGQDGPMLSFRGLDNATYYRLDGDARDVDTTGCGNSLDAREFRVVQLILDSLRYWVREMGVDGFRFDLAPTLARGRDGYDPDHPLLVAIRADPLLAGVKLIAEPWDVGPFGWRTGQFPPPFAEWNDRYRNDVREFWLPGTARAEAHEPGGGLGGLVTRLAGSDDLFGRERGPLASVNFVTAHDGMTLADLVSYNGKHNQANGEGNRDGSDDNRSWNHGEEGPTDRPDVLQHRRRTLRGLLGTLLLSTGVPMLTAGDELGRTQQGNNNAYCQDNAVSWLDWELAPWQRDLLETTRQLLRIRREHPVLRQDRIFAGRDRREDGSTDLAWLGRRGHELTDADWRDPSRRTLQVLFDPRFVPGGGAGVLLVVNGAAHGAHVTLPSAPWAAGYRHLWDSAAEPPLTRSPRRRAPGSVVVAAAGSLYVFEVDPA